MKYIKLFEAFTKDYMKKIDLKDFKKIKKGAKIKYMGGSAVVIDNNGYVLTLKGEGGKTVTVNKSQFDHGGMISEISVTNEGLKAKTPNEVITIDLDMGWDDSNPEEDKAAKAAFKKYKIKVEPASHSDQEGTFEVTGKKKDILAYLQSEFYEMDADAIEEYYPELLEGTLDEEVLKSFGIKYRDLGKLAKAAIDESVVNEAEKYITDEFKVGDKIKTGFGEWEVIETDYAPNKSFMGSFIFKGKDMKRVNIPNPPRTNKNAVGYKVTDGDKYPIIGFLYQYKDITKLATVGVDESLVTEGQFSWMTQDTGNQIGSEKENTIAVTMFDDKGNKWLERKYDGYGEFGGKDYYELLAQMNGVENADRQDGIDIALGKMKIKGDVLFPALIEKPNRFNFKRHDFTQEPENDPNQSWYQEPEYDDDDNYDDSNESKVTEGKDSALQDYVNATSQKTFKGGGNGQNLLDSAMELANHIDNYRQGRDTRGYEEDGFYGPLTITAFKKLVDQMSADDIKNNQADKNESLDVNESSAKDGGDKSNGNSHHDDHTDNSIAQHWKDTYGEEFHSKYPAVAKIVKQRNIKDKRELKRIWDETYGENFEEQYPALYNKLD
jgi:hypothetical protein